MQGRGRQFVPFSGMQGVGERHGEGRRKEVAVLVKASCADVKGRYIDFAIVEFNPSGPEVRGDPIEQSPMRCGSGGRGSCIRWGLGSRRVTRGMRGPVTSLRRQSLGREAVGNDV